IHAGSSPLAKPTWRRKIESKALKSEQKAIAHRTARIIELPSPNHGKTQSETRKKSGKDTTLQKRSSFEWPEPKKEISNTDQNVNHKRLKR
ncbi:unnamed protein product, partial [Brassica oleracea var. botrytis]